MPSDLEVALLRLIEVFDKLEIRYAIGGSFASSAYGIPRATQDADVLADLKRKDIETIVRTLENDFYLSRESITEAVRTKSSFNIIHLRNMHKIDIFVAEQQGWHQEELDRSRRLRLTPSSNRSLPFPARKITSFTN